MTVTSAMMSTQQLLWCFFTVFAAFFCSTSACYEDELYVIRSRAYSDLVVDGTNSSSISVQFFTNSTGQLWSFERGSKAGLFYITNNRTGKVLDVQATEKELVLAAKEKKDVKRQQWSLRMDGRIVNSESGRNFDIRGAKFFPGTPVIAWTENGNAAQEFLWEKVQGEEEAEANP